MGAEHAALGSALMQGDGAPTIVATLADAVAALDAAPGRTGMELWSPPDAASIQGVLWFVALQQALDRDHAEAQAQIVLDCGMRADCAIEALRAGLPAVALAEIPADTTAKIADIAVQLGAKVYSRA